MWHDCLEQSQKDHGEESTALKNIRCLLVLLHVLATSAYKGAMVLAVLISVAFYKATPEWTGDVIMDSAPWQRAAGCWGVVVRKWRGVWAQGIQLRNDMRTRYIEAMARNRFEGNLCRIGEGLDYGRCLNLRGHTLKLGQNLREECQDDRHRKVQLDDMEFWFSSNRIRVSRGVLELGADIQVHVRCPSVRLGLVTCTSRCFDTRASSRPSSGSKPSSANKPSDDVSCIVSLKKSAVEACVILTGLEPTKENSNMILVFQNGAVGLGKGTYVSVADCVNPPGHVAVTINGPNSWSAWFRTYECRA